MLQVAHNLRSGTINGHAATSKLCRVASLAVLVFDRTAFDLPSTSEIENLNWTNPLS